MTLYPEIGKRYRHYKGGLYEVISLARHTETEESLVIYKSIHFGSVHARPLTMWFDIIEVNGIHNAPRFELID